MCRDTKYTIEVSSDVISVNLPELANVALKTPVLISFANRLVSGAWVCFSVRKGKANVVWEIDDNCQNVKISALSCLEYEVQTGDLFVRCILSQQVNQSVTQPVLIHLTL